MSDLERFSAMVFGIDSELELLLEGGDRRDRTADPNVASAAASAVNLYFDGEISAEQAIPAVRALRNRLIQMLTEDDVPDPIALLISMRDWYWTTRLVGGAKRADIDADELRTLCAETCKAFGAMVVFHTNDAAKA